MARDELEVRVAGDSEEVGEAQELRLRVFADEQGITREGEIDGLDPESTHLVALRREVVVGTCRLRFTGGECKLERMAVERGLRRTGIGSRLVRAAELVAAQRGASEVVLHAQRACEDFYAACGYASEGETFFEEGIPHVLMRRRLTGSAPAVA